MRNLKQFFAVLSLCLAFTTASADNYNATTMGEKVVEMETAQWGQSYPFNEQCFTDVQSTTHAKAGCVPVAYAIVMRHHGFPTEGTGKLYNCLSGEIITDRTYDFGKMPLVYDGNWTTEQVNEASKLVSHIGHAFMVSYGSGGTSVSDPMNTDKMTKFFNYGLVYAQYQRDNTKEEWKKKIKASLDNNCPVIYASDNAGTGDTRHMFVIDGYTANDYFHFNFGWYGASNGWFPLESIKPSQGDDYSWQNGSDHYAIFNFAPSKNKCTLTASVSPNADAGTVSINGGATGSTAEAVVWESSTAILTAATKLGYAFVNWTKNGEVVGTDKEIKVTVEEANNEYVANFIASSSEPIDYKISPETGVLNNGNTTTKSYVWILTEMQGLTLESNYATMNVNNSALQLYAASYDEVASATISPITYTISAPNDSKIAGYTIRYKKGSSSHAITITADGVEAQTPVDASEQVFAVSGLDVESVSFQLQGTAASNFIKIIDFTVTIKGEANTPVPTPQYTITTNVAPVGAGTVTGAGSYAQGSTVTLTATPNEGYEFVNWTSGAGVAGTEPTISFTADADAEYIANFKLAEQGGSETAVEKVEVSNEKVEIYDLRGCRIDEITKPGIYIINGKKSVVK